MNKEHSRSGKGVEGSPRTTHLPLSGSGFYALFAVEEQNPMRHGGRQNVAVLVGGLRAWVREGLPTKSGATK